MVFLRCVCVVCFCVIFLNWRAIVIFMITLRLFAVYIYAMFVANACVQDLLCGMCVRERVRVCVCVCVCVCVS